MGSKKGGVAPHCWPHLHPEWPARQLPGGKGRWWARFVPPSVRPGVCLASPPLHLFPAINPLGRLSTLLLPPWAGDSQGWQSPFKPLRIKPGGGCAAGGVGTTRWPRRRAESQGGTGEKEAGGRQKSWWLYLVPVRGVVPGSPAGPVPRPAHSSCCRKARSPRCHSSGLSR